jgi:hypothetical protein
VTFPTKPVPPMKKIFLPLNISVGESFIRTADALVRTASVRMRNHIFVLRTHCGRWRPRSFFNPSHCTTRSRADAAL